MTKDRSLIESKYKWKIDEMYNSQDSINNDIKKVEELISKVKEYKGKLDLSKDNLYNALKISVDASRILSNLYVYTHMKLHEDTRINENQAPFTGAFFFAFSIDKGEFGDYHRKR